jgi:hypothetical protein
LRGEATEKDFGFDLGNLHVFFLVCGIVGSISKDSKPKRPLPAKVQFNRESVYVTNLGPENWDEGIHVYINGTPPFTYEAKAGSLGTNETVKIALDEFSKGNGERFDPSRYRVTEMWVGGSGYDYVGFESK